MPTLLMMNVEPLPGGASQPSGLGRASQDGAASQAPSSPHAPVAWRHEGGNFYLEIEAPAETPVRITFPNGAKREFAGGRFSESVVLS